MHTGFTEGIGKSMRHYVKHPLYKPPVTDTTVPSPGHIENMPDSPVSPVMAMPKVDYGMDSMCSLTNTSDMRTDEEKAELLAWVRPRPIFLSSSSSPLHLLGSTLRCPPLTLWSNWWR